MGKMILVEVIECSKFSMKGKVLDQVLESPLRPAQYKLGEITGLKKVILV